MTGIGSTRCTRGIQVVGLTIAMALGLGGSAMAATAKRAPVATAHPEAGPTLMEMRANGDILRYGDPEILARLVAKGVDVGADESPLRASILTQINEGRQALIKGTQLEGIDLSTGIGRTPQNPIRIHPLSSNITQSSGNRKWDFEKGTAQARSGLYPLPIADSIPLYTYENDFVFRSVSAAGTFSDDMDMLTFAGACPTPPEGIVSLEYLFNVYGGQPQHGNLRRRLRIWDTWNPAAPLNTSVVTNELVGSPVNTIQDVNFGPVPPALFLTEIITLESPLYPTHADNLGVEFKFTDYDPNTQAESFTSVTQWQPEFPPQAGCPDCGNPPNGDSGNFEYRDIDRDTILEANESFFFSTSNSLLKANLWIHIGGQTPATEIEPNNAPGTETVLCYCDNRTANINPAVDIDLYKLNLAFNDQITVQVQCAGPGSTTLTVTDSCANTYTATGCPATVTAANLCAGNVSISVTGDGSGNIPYKLDLKALALRETGLKVNTDKSTLVWDSQPNSTYDVIFGDLLQLGATAGNFADPSVMFGCWEGGLSNPTEPNTPVPSQTSESSWWLVRAKNFCASTGTYNEDAITPAGYQDHDRDPQIAANPNGDCP